MVLERGGTRGIGRDKSPVTKSENSDNIKLVRKKTKKNKKKQIPTHQNLTISINGV